MVETFDLFEAREHVLPRSFLKAWASQRGQELYRRLELGEISQKEWNDGFGALLGIDPANLMGRVLGDMMPAYDVLKVAREARTAGVRTAVLSNSLGREPFDPYDRYDLARNFDVAVLSSDYAIRKPDPAIFALVLEQLGVPAEACVFADDTEDNLVPAAGMGMTVLHALDEQETAARLRQLLGLRSR
jgi:putative hydrolase of the HAD superfamily